jgi:hypothetical protein
VFEIAGLRRGERLAKSNHPRVPSLFTHHGEPLDILVVESIPLDVLPERATVPTVKIIVRVPPK